MNLFVLNAFLAIGWGALMGSFSTVNLLAGYVLGFGALWVARPLFGETRYFRRVGRMIGLAGFFLYELVISSLRVAWDVVTPPIYARPGIIIVPLEEMTDAEILLVSNLVSLTPGTLSLDVSEDRRNLFVHAMFIDDPDRLRQEIKDGMERRVLEAFR